MRHGNPRNALRAAHRVWPGAALAGLLLALLLAGCSSSTGETELGHAKPLAPFPPARRYVVAVIPFQYKADPPQFRKDAEKAADMTLEALFRTQRVRVIERTRLNEVLGEIALGQSGVLDDAAVAKVGRQLGAEAIVLGTVAAVNKVNNRDSIWKLAYVEESGLEVSLKARIIDVAHGELLAAAEATASEVAQKKVALGASTGTIPQEQVQFNRALEKSVELLAYRLGQQMPAKP